MAQLKQTNDSKGFSSFNPSPLLGGSFLNLIKLLTRHKVTWPFFPRLFPAFLLTLITIPLRCWDHLHFRFFAKNNSVIPKPPIFIIGHWRSGTTHLHNLLCQAPDASYITTYQSVFPDLLRSKLIFKTFMKMMLHEKRPGDNVIMDASNPQEDEFALSNLTLYNYYHFMYFPREYEHFYNQYVRFQGPLSVVQTWKKIYKKLLQKTLQNIKGDQLILKNPVNTGRIKTLLDLFPKAKFIFIHRNPVHVYLSTKKFLLHLYPTLQLQPITEREVIELILDVYEKIMNDYLLQRNLIPEGQLIEIRYTDLEDQPIALLSKLYSSLGLNNYAEAELLFKDYLDRKKNYQKNKHQINQSELDQVLARWDFAMKKWGYRIPDDLNHQFDRA